MEQRSFVAQEALPIRIKDGDQADLRDVQPFTEEVDAHDDIDEPKAQCVDDFRPLDGVDLRMQVVGLDAHAAQVRRDFLCELDGQHGDQGPFSTLDTCVDF